MDYKEVLWRLKDHFVRHQDKVSTPFLDIVEKLTYEAIEYRIPKAPIHIEKTHLFHKWKLDKEGIINMDAWDWDIHNGPECEVCGETFCINCVSDAEEKLKGSCKENYWACPTCEEKVYLGFKKDRVCPNCGQVLDWSEDNE